METSLDTMVQNLYSQDPIQALNGVKSIRALLSTGENQFLKEIVFDRKLVPLFLNLLENSSNKEVQNECIWVIVNITGGSSDYTQAVISTSGAISNLIRFVTNSDATIAENAIWALSNMAGDNAAARDSINQTPLLTEIRKLNFIEGVIPPSLGRTVAWCITNLCRPMKSKKPRLESVLPGLDVLELLLHHSDIETVRDAAHSIKYICGISNEAISRVVGYKRIPGRLVELLRIAPNICESIIPPVLDAVANIISGNNAVFVLSLTLSLLILTLRFLRTYSNRGQRTNTVNGDRGCNKASGWATGFG